MLELLVKTLFELDFAFNEIPLDNECFVRHKKKKNNRLFKDTTIMQLGLHKTLNLY